MEKNNFFRITFHTSIFTVLALMCFNCQEKGSKIKTTVQNNLTSTVIAKPHSTFTDTVIISAASAVFYQPDSLQLEKIRSVNPRNIYESLTHESFYQMRNARMVLKSWPNVKVIEISKARYLSFIKADKTKDIIDLDSKNDIAGIFLFDKDKDPELTDMMNIETELGFYFKK
ncbi:MAG: hypothetical protein ABJA57_06160 [Ginsengibacter sp.]